MADDLQLYIAFFTPSIALRFFDEVVLPGGADSYEVSKDDGAYLLRSRYTNSIENERIHLLTGINIRTRVSVSVVRPSEVSTMALVSSTAFRLAHEITREFLLVDDMNKIIIMREGRDLIVNEGMEARFDLDVHDLHFEVRQLPPLET